MISSVLCLQPLGQHTNAIAHGYVSQAYGFFNAGRLNEALSCMYYATQNDRTNPSILCQYANMLRYTKQLPEALQVFRVAAHFTRSADIHISIGQVLEELGRSELALAEYNHSLILAESAQGYFCKANLLNRLGMLKELTEVYMVALQKFPNDPQLLNSIGNIYLERQSLKEAMVCYSQAVHYSPYFVPAICNLSSVLRLNKQSKAAIEVASRAMLIDSNFVDAYICLGNALKDEGKVSDAVMWYEKAVSLSPKHIGAMLNLANSFKETGFYSKAIGYFHKVLEMTVWSSEASEKDQGAAWYLQVLNELVQAKTYVCNWTDLPFYFDKLKEVLKAQLALGEIPAVQPFHCFTYPLRLEDKHLIAKCYARQAKERAGPVLFHHSATEKDIPSKKLRIGYVSSDICNHPLAHLMQSVFGFHDRKQFEVILFTLTPDDGSVYRRKIASEVAIVDLSGWKDDQWAAHIINSHKIDVLINLNGYTKGARNEIFALQPAPVQVAYLGFPGTLGASYIQFMIADRVVVPLQLTQHYTEKMIYMPHSYFVNDHAQSSEYVLKDDRPTRQEFGLPTDKFIFASFNQLYKIDHHIFKIWMSILKRVPYSVLWLLRFPPQGEEFIRLAAEAEGITAQRIIFTDTVAKDLHINRCYLADLVLDTPLCNGHTTSCDALWSGAPVLTLPLEALAARVAASVLTAAGCPELIALTAAAYEETAVRLATGPIAAEDDLPYALQKRHGSTELKRMRHKVELSRKSALFDTKAWVKAMESGLRAAYDQYKRGSDWTHIQLN